MKCTVCTHRTRKFGKYDIRFKESEKIKRKQQDKYFSTGLLDIVTNETCKGTKLKGKGKLMLASARVEFRNN